MKPGGWVLTILIALAIVALGSIFAAHAEGKSDWFKSLAQPGTGYSCCDISDCAATNARFAGGHWEAEYQGVFTPVPDDKILDKESWDGRAYLCARPGFGAEPPHVYCFVRPGGQS